MERVLGCMGEISGSEASIICLIDMIGKIWEGGGWLVSVEVLVTQKA